MFLTVSEGDITEAHSHRQLIGKDNDGKPKFGEMRLTHAVYSYPDNFKVKTAIRNSLNGEIYKRESE